MYPSYSKTLLNILTRAVYLNSDVSCLLLHWSYGWNRYCLLTGSVITLTSTANFRIGRRLEHASTNSLWIMQNNKFTFVPRSPASQYVGLCNLLKKYREVYFDLLHAKSSLSEPAFSVLKESKVWQVQINL